jgi:hypothetical protein
MKKWIILFSCSLSCLGNAQNTNQFTTPDNYSYSPNYNLLRDSIHTEDPGQEKQLRYGVSINQSLTLYEIPTAVLFTLHYKKHQFDLGPQFKLGVPIRADQKNIGMEFNYRYYPLGDRTWFGPYILFNAAYFHEFSKRTGVYSSSDPALNNQPTVYSHTRQNVVLNLGYGVKFTLVGGFYVGSHVGIGMYYNSNAYERTMTQLEWSSVNKSKGVNVGYLASVFIGYKF